MHGRFDITSEKKAKHMTHDERGGTHGKRPTPPDTAGNNGRAFVDGSGSETLPRMCTRARVCVRVLACVRA